MYNISLERGNLYIFTWLDAVSDSSWKKIELAEVESPVLAKTVGWFLNEDDKCIRTVSSVTDDKVNKEVSMDIIPKGMIVNIELVRKDKLDFD